jgi:hypothetical protein
MLSVIQPNSRVQFTAEDLEFILSALRNQASDAECLTRLLADEEARDLILDDESLLRAVLENRNCLRVSAHFYFYILVRHAFRRSGLKERPLADYVAAVLAEFSKIERMRCCVQGRPPLDYFFDMLAALQTVDDTSRFYIRAHIGNYSLFLAGVFPDHIRFRAEMKGAPSLGYYESLGRANYRAASDHRLARKYDLDTIFDTLAERFQETCLALNDVRERLVTLGDPEPRLDQLIRSAD